MRRGKFGCVGQNQWYPMLGIGAPIVEPILGGIGMQSKKRFRHVPHRSGTPVTLRVEVHTLCSYPLASLVSNSLYKGFWGEGYEHQQANWVHFSKGYVNGVCTLAPLE